MQSSHLVTTTVTPLLVAATETTILESTPMGNYDLLSLTLTNTTTTALNSCKLYFKSHPSAAYVAVISTWSTTASALNPITTTALQTLNNATSLVTVNLNRCYAWKLTATVAANTTPVTAYAMESGYAVENATS